MHQLYLLYYLSDYEICTFSQLVLQSFHHKVNQEIRQGVLFVPEYSKMTKYKHTSKIHMHNT